MLQSTPQAAELDRRAQRLQRRGAEDEALELLKKGAEKHPLDAFILMHCGLALLRRGEAQVASDYFQRAIQAAPQMPVPRVFLGAAFLDLGRAQDALEAFNEAVRLDSGYRAACAWQGLAMMAGGTVADGLARLRRYRRYADAPMLASRILCFCEEFAASRGGPPFGDERPAPGFAMRIDEYYDMLERGLLAPMEKAIGDVLFAVSSIERLLAPKRFEARLLWRQAYAEAARGDKKAAAEKALKRLQLVPFDADSFLWTLWLQYESGDYESVDKLLRILEEETGEPAADHPVPAEIMARIHYRRGQYDEALQYARAHSESRVSDHGPRYARALCLLKKGRRAEALHWFAEALDRPNPRLLDARLRDLEEMLAQTTAPPATV